MRPIPLEHRKIIDSDPYYKKSCLSGLKGHIEIHHAWIYAGKQISELWNYMPLLKDEHEEVHKNLALRNKVKFLSLQRVSMEELYKKYQKRNWEQEYEYLQKQNKRNTNTNNDRTLSAISGEIR